MTTPTQPVDTENAAIAAVSAKHPGFSQGTSPRLAIRAFCVECHGGPRYATACCTQLCEVWHYRTGHRGKGATTGPLPAIRARCRDCTAQEGAHAIKNCGCPHCALYPFRTGHNPHAPRRTLTPEERQAAVTRLAAARERKAKS